MANVTLIHTTFSGESIAPDGTQYFWLGPEDVFRTGGAITVTAIPRTGSPDATLAMEVIQTGVRTEVKSFAPPDIFLDIVVRNNSHQGAPAASTITDFDVYVSVVNP